jgi:hypothetical protein
MPSKRAASCLAKHLAALALLKFSYSAPLASYRTQIPLVYTLIYKKQCSIMENNTKALSIFIECRCFDVYCLRPAQNPFF